MTSFGAGPRRHAGRPVPAEFADAHLTSNLLLDPADAPRHTAWFDDEPPSPGARTIDICIDSPTFGVMRLGSLTLPDGRDDGDRSGEADGHAGAGSDHEHGAYDEAAGRLPADAYLEAFLESAARARQERAEADHSPLPDPSRQTFAEASRTVRAVLDDTDHYAIAKAVLNAPYPETAGDTRASAWNAPVPPVQLAMLFDPWKVPNQGSARGHDDDTSASGPLPPSDRGNGPRPGGAVAGGVIGMIAGGIAGTLIEPGFGTLIGGALGAEGALDGVVLGTILGGTTLPLGGSATHMEGSPDENEPNRSDEQAEDNDTLGTRSSPSPNEIVRQKYKEEVAKIPEKVRIYRELGLSSEEIARLVSAERRELSEKYKEMTSPEQLEQIYRRNLKSYGDKLGPTVDWLRSHGRS